MRRAPRRPAAVLMFLASAVTVGACPRKSAPEPSAKPGPEAAPGRAAYVRLCATCHGPAGNGYIADNAPSLRTTTFLASVSDDFLRAAITRGRPGTAMAAFGKALGGPLEPAQVDGLVSFLRQGGPPPWTPPAAARARGDGARGHATFDAYCARCHGTPTQRKSAVHLANPVLLETASDAFLRYAIEEGRPPTSMVPWKTTLTPAQIDDVIGYLRSMNALAAAAAPPAAPPPAPPAWPPPLLPRRGPLVLNPRGRSPKFTLKENLYVSIDQVKEALDRKQRIIVADARVPSEWLKLRIAGAISTPYYELKSLDDLPNDGTWVVAYCACPHHVSGQIVDELRKRGFKHTAVIDEGIFAWQQKGYPVIAAPGQPPIPAPPPPPSLPPSLPPSSPSPAHPHP